jgi:hypothetical protein
MAAIRVLLLFMLVLLRSPIKRLGFSVSMNLPKSFLGGGPNARWVADKRAELEANALIWDIGA